MKFVGDFSGIQGIGKILLARKDKKKGIPKFILVQPSLKSQPPRHIPDRSSQLQGYTYNKRRPDDDPRAVGKYLVHKDKKKGIPKFILVQPSLKFFAGQGNLTIEFN